MRVSTEGTETDENGDTIELTDEEKAEKKDIAQRFMDALNASEDPASVIFADLRTEINDQLNEERRAEEAAAQEDSSTAEDETGDAAQSDSTEGTSGDAAQSDSTADTSGDSSSTDTEEDSDVVYLTSSQTTFGADDEDLDDALKEAAETLSDGEVYGEVIEGEDAYYVVRMDSVLDRDATDSQKETIVQERQSEAYSDLLDGWIEESDISVKRAWNRLEVTDYDLYTMTVDSADSSTSTDSTAETNSAANTDSAAETDSTANTDSSAG